jgi:hypothetical protein
VRIGTSSGSAPSRTYGLVNAIPVSPLPGLEPASNACKLVGSRAATPARAEADSYTVLLHTKAKRIVRPHVTLILGYFRGIIRMAGA